MLALGGDTLSDVGLARGEPAIFGRVASDPVVSRLITALGKNPGPAVRAISQARAEARAQAWRLAKDKAPTWDRSVLNPLIIDLDATLVTAHSDKQGAQPTFKKGYGHHPLTASVDHGPDGTGEMLTVVLRPGNAGSVRHEVARVQWMHCGGGVVVRR